MIHSVAKLASLADVWHHHATVHKLWTLYPCSETLRRRAAEPSWLEAVTVRKREATPRVRRAPHPKPLTAVLFGKSMELSQLFQGRKAITSKGNVEGKHEQ